MYTSLFAKLGGAKIHQKQEQQQSSWVQVSIFQVGTNLET